MYGVWSSLTSWISQKAWIGKYAINLVGPKRLGIVDFVSFFILHLNVHSEIEGQLN